MKNAVTSDGRCFRCVQRKRHVIGSPVWIDGEPRHMALDGVILCSAAKPGRKPRDKEYMKAQRKKYEARIKIEQPHRRAAWERKAALKKRYGMTLEEYDTFLALQSNKCAICQKENPAVVDHNHVTGDVRGILCIMCNMMLGQAYDNPDILRAGADYLSKEPLKVKAFGLARQYAGIK